MCGLARGKCGVQLKNRHKKVKWCIVGELFLNVFVCGVDYVRVCSTVYINIYYCA